MDTDFLIPIMLFGVIGYIVKVVAENRTRRLLAEKGEINENLKYLISGDTIFEKGNIGRTDLPGGDILALHKSIKRINELEINGLFPGHYNIVMEGAQDQIARSLENLEHIIHSGQNF